MLYNWLKHITFAQPGYLLLLLLLPVLVLIYAKKGSALQSGFLVSTSAPMKSLNSWKTTLRHALLVLRLLSLACLIIALARPQRKFEEERKEGEGIDIMLCIDVSGSMMAQDLLPDRLEAAKQVAIDFVRRRATDRIGIVIFSGESFTLVPLTTDKQVLQAQLQGIQRGLLEDGTAIGDGLGISIDRLRNSAVKSKVVILLTDGEDQGGRISPLEAKVLAKQYGIRVYSIGVGTKGYAPFPVQTAEGKVVQQMQKVNIDEALLRSIALETGGWYYRAEDTERLKAIYEEIDQLERSRVEVTQVKKAVEKFHPFAWAAALFVIIESVLRFTVFRKFP